MKKYLIPIYYAKHGLRIANEYLLSPMESIIGPDYRSPLRYPPVFILGAPRCGSTLAMQLITESLDLGYISNQHCRFFGAPALAEYLFRPTTGRPPSDFKSSTGVTRGSHAPAECGNWWYRFFRKSPSYVTLGEADPSLMRAFRASVALLTNASNRPIIFKNLYASLRIQPIAHYLPESLFIVIRRDEIDNAHSLLETRMERFGNYDDWFSMEPPGGTWLKSLPAPQQVVEQVRQIYRTIEQDFQAAEISTGRRLQITYEDLCKNPANTIQMVKSFLRASGCEVAHRSTPISGFSPRSTVRIDETLYRAVVDYARRS